MTALGWSWMACFAFMIVAACVDGWLTGARQARIDTLDRLRREWREERAEIDRRIAERWRRQREAIR